MKKDLCLNISIMIAFAVLILISVCLILSRMNHRHIRIAWYWIVIILILSFLLIGGLYIWFGSVRNEELFVDKMGDVRYVFNCDCEYDGGFLKCGSLVICENSLFYYLDRFKYFIFFFDSGDLTIDLTGDSLCITCKRHDRIYYRYWIITDSVSLKIIYDMLYNSYANFDERFYEALRKDVI